MRNKIIPINEIEAVKECLNEVNNIVKVHSSVTPDMDNASSLDRISTIIYLDIISDFLKKASVLRGFLEISEDEFLRLITEDGKLSLCEAETKVLMNGLINAITR